MLHRVKDLSPEQKLTIESLLGRSVSEDEAVTIRVEAPTAIFPSRLTDEQREAALEKLNRYFVRVDSQRRPVSDEEEESIIDEALRSTRPNYRPTG
jgi:hypothetical protein